jgi:hypothetical protein
LLSRLIRYLELDTVRLPLDENVEVLRDFLPDLLTETFKCAPKHIRLYSDHREVTAIKRNVWQQTIRLEFVLKIAPDIWNDKQTVSIASDNVNAVEVAGLVIVYGPDAIIGTVCDVTITRSLRQQNQLVVKLYKFAWSRV